MAPTRCSVCNGDRFERAPVLWPELVQQWQLAPFEVEYVDRQQGERCASCGANLRSIALADALKWAFRTELCLREFCQSEKASKVRLLELNEAGALHSALKRCAGHVFGAYPEVDMHALPYDAASFDIVVHSDTLEHVRNPLHALRECLRVLVSGGILCFTVPIVVGRLSRSREGLSKSFHGSPDEADDSFVVHTEFGADAWTYPFAAGFSELHMFSVEYPAAIAIATRSGR